MSSVEAKVREAMRLLAEAGCLDVLVGGGMQPCPVMRAASGVVAAVIAYLRKEGQEQVSSRGHSCVCGLVKAKGMTQVGVGEGLRGLSGLRSGVGTGMTADPGDAKEGRGRGETGAGPRERSEVNGRGVSEASVGGRQELVETGRNTSGTDDPAPYKAGSSEKMTPRGPVCCQIRSDLLLYSLARTIL
ncbi:hypothetical protein NDU88_006779 [Pleurodeles waltl]|uniref:Uncharacterized protein n=1 Tax=Pleurodeles waltl TaxID=8319 RepID=A0AAV7NZ24_PLEWA|nr:hypothetical protein NDU88_006779 [Pleurodeles waltl]